MNKWIAWFADNHVAANLLMLFCVFGGVLTLFSIKIEVFPEFSLDKVNVGVVYLGASPAEVEESVVRRIEERVAGVEGVRRIDSVAREGYGSVTVEAVQGWSLQKLLDDVKAEVDRITTLPDEAEKPVVKELTQRTQVMWLAVFGDADEYTVKHLTEKVKDEVTTLPGVTMTELFGVRKGEIVLEVSEDTLRRHNLTLGAVADKVRQGSLDLPAGSLKTTGSEVLVRSKGRRYHAADYGDITVLSNPDGSRVALEQLAELTEGFEDIDLFARFQGKPAGLVQIFRVVDQNVLSMAEELQNYVARVRPTLPAGMDIGIFADRSVILKSRLNLLLTNMAQGMVLVVLTLWLFLNGRLAFWVALGVPVAFLVAIWCLPVVDISINMISLFGFITVLGIVVDDAIVVGENNFRLRQEGKGPLEAAVRGTQEVAGPVVFSVLTTVAAFAPLLMGTGTMGKVMRNIPLVVCVVLLGSLLEALFVLPSHLAGAKVKFELRPDGSPKEKWASRHLSRFVQGPYSRFLDWCLRWRYLTVAAGVAVLFLSLGTFTGGWLKFTLFPKVESDVITAELEMPAGTPVERTMAAVERLEEAGRRAIAELDAKRGRDAPSLMEYLVSLVGIKVSGAGHSSATEISGNQATLFMQLLEGQRRDVATMAVLARWRELTGDIPEAESLTFTSDLFKAGNAIEVHLSHSDDQKLTAAVEEMKTYLRTLPGVFDITDSFLPGKPEMQLNLKPAGRALGLTLNELASQVRHAFYGAEALRIQRDQDEVKVMVRFPEAERRSLTDVERMRIRTADGKEVPFSEVAQVKMERGYANLQRANRKRVIKVIADVDETKSNAAEIRRELENVYIPQLLNRYPDLRYDMEGEGREQRESMADVQKGLLIALAGIYVLLAIPFRSFTQPFIIMVSIPFGVVGAIIGHLVMGFNLSLMSMFGIVGLAGVVVNDAIVLIDKTNTLRKAGASANEAIRRAGPLRFRAILLTSVTTFAGLMPIILERSMQAQFLIPMAISLGFGVMFATGITLLLIPCFYLILEDIHQVWERLRAGSRVQAGPARQG